MLNIEAKQAFVIDVSAAIPIGYKKDNTPIIGPPLIIKSRKALTIDKNKNSQLGIGIEIPPNAVSGTYIFNVKVIKSDGSLYVPVQKLYVEVPQ